MAKGSNNRQAWRRATAGRSAGRDDKALDVRMNRALEVGAPQPLVRALQNVLGREACHVAR
jgi:hypothetical protein